MGRHQGSPDGGIQRGREAVGDRARTWAGTFSEYSFELEEVVDAGEQVVVVYRDRGRGQTSGVEVKHRWGLLVSVDGGRITRTVFYPSPEDALEAAGLSSSQESRAGGRSTTVYPRSA